MTIPLRTLDELHGAPHMTALPGLSASIQAFSAALEIAHPALLVVDPPRPRDTAALLLRMYLDACHELLRHYDRLTFDHDQWSDGTEERPDDAEPDDDLPF